MTIRDLRDAEFTKLYESHYRVIFRYFAVLPAIALASLWAYYLIVGQPTTGLGGPERDIRTIFHSDPMTLALFLALTLLVASPTLIARFRAGRTPHERPNEVGDRQQVST